MGDRTQAQQLYKAGRLLYAEEKYEEALSAFDRVSLLPSLLGTAVLVHAFAFAVVVVLRTGPAAVLPFDFLGHSRWSAFFASFFCYIIPSEFSDCGRSAIANPRLSRSVIEVGRSWTGRWRR